MHRNFRPVVGLEQPNRWLRQKLCCNYGDTGRSNVGADISDYELAFGRRLQQAGRQRKGFAKQDGYSRRVGYNHAAVVHNGSAVKER